jgi:hypothetical protein
MTPMTKLALRRNYSGRLDHGRSSLADVTRSQADADGETFGYLGVRIRGADVWTIGHGSPGRYLGPLAGARAGVTEPGRSRIGLFISGKLLGDVAPRNATIFVAFPDGSCYERMAVPWLFRADWPKIAGQIGRFNAAASLA